MVTQAAGYRGKVTVYNAAYDPVMSVNLTSAFVMDAALSDDEARQVLSQKLAAQVPDCRPVITVDRSHVL